MDNVNESAVIDQEFLEEDSETALVQAPPDLSPEARRYVESLQERSRREVAEAEYRTAERIAADLETSGVMLRPEHAAQRVRSMAWAKEAA